ncbi:MAG: ATP-dependent DNA helicase RecG [Zetaproteobacteria bacterium]|nr:MAG: ATP-dependent DNA helicase RecG [Zetaproteobacteria bacterium]
MYAFLHRPLTDLDGIGSKLASALASQGCHCWGDLLLHVPKRYQDDRKIETIGNLIESREIRLAGCIIDRRAQGIGRKRQVILRLADDHGEISLLFFHSGYMMHDARLAPGNWITARGMAKRWKGRWQMAHPEWQPLAAFRPTIRPVYATLGGLSSKRIQRYLELMLASMPTGLASPLDILARQWSPLTLDAALRGIHQPSETTDPGSCLLRLKLEELLVYLALMREKRREAGRAAAPMRRAEASRRLQAGLPYPLTDAQREAWDAIQRDLASGQRMHRLVQGDVGAGKTWVAALAMAHAMDNGWQSAMLAPTEVLARQHAETLSALLNDFGEVALLTGGMPSRNRQKLLKGLSDGSVPFVVGTHALLVEDVRFARLGLAIVDEQHRFGVRQRWALADQKAPDQASAVHLLSMTATPIPRSLALALYGDMDLTLMRGMPPGRKPVETRLLPTSKMPALMGGMRRILAQGGRIYWIVPRVDEQEDGRSVAQRTEILRKHFPDAGVLGLHGRMQADEKQRTLQAFADGSCSILVSTTVVEVGVNVPEARLIIIEQAERYGLAQLHQLRGRVGRSDEQGYCILIPGEDVGQAGLARLRTMTQCHDGLELAEADLKLRGAGDALGLRQSGSVGFRLIDLAEDHALIRACHEALPSFTPSDDMIRFWRPVEALSVD